MASHSPIEFWFDFSSPYAYFAADAIGVVAGRHGRTVLWRPYMLGVAFRLTGMGPLDKMPLRGPYALHDWNRLARQTGLSFRLPANHPVTALPATRAFYWIEETEPETSTIFARRAFTAYFADGRDTSQASEIANIAAECGIARGPLLEAIASPRLKQKVKAVTDDAISHGIFGSPFFIVDGEPFWGQDRVHTIDEWLGRGGW